MALDRAVGLYEPLFIHKMEHIYFIGFLQWFSYYLFNSYSMCLIKNIFYMYANTVLNI